MFADLDWFETLEAIAKVGGPILLGVGGSVAGYLLMPRCPTCSRRVPLLNATADLGLGWRNKEATEYLRKRRVAYCRHCEAFFYDAKQALGTSVPMVLPLDPHELIALGELKPTKTPAGRKLQELISKDLLEGKSWSAPPAPG